MLKAPSCRSPCLQARPSARNVRRGAAAPAKQTIELEDLMKVIETVDQSDVVEMELKGRKFAMTVRKQEALQAQEPVYISAAPAAALPAAAAPAAAPAAPAPAPSAAPAAAPPAAAAADAAVSGGVEIVAPMSGTVYRKPAPGEPIFVKEGDEVAIGQSICIIEAMKLMNEIEADVSGTVVKWVAEDAKPIEPGQVICIVEP